MYNLIGVIVIYGIPFLRNIPIRVAESLAEAAVTNKLYVVAYIAGVFFIMPLILIGGSQMLGI
jgi:sodium-dependent phosphate cotransporter